MAVSMNPGRIVGKWISGYALDIHTTSSICLAVNDHGHDVYDSKRSEPGELLYRIKYRGDHAAVPEIVATAVAFRQRLRNRFDLIVPVPPSGVRRVQPVRTIAEGIGRALD